MFNHTYRVRFRGIDEDGDKVQGVTTIKSFLPPTYNACLNAAEAYGLKNTKISVVARLKTPKELARKAKEEQEQAEYEQYKKQKRQKRLDKLNAKREAREEKKQAKFDRKLEKKEAKLAKKASV